MNSFAENKSPEKILVQNLFTFSFSRELGTTDSIEPKKFGKGILDHKRNKSTSLKSQSNLYDVIGLWVRAIGSEKLEVISKRGKFSFQVRDLSTIETTSFP